MQRKQRFFHFDFKYVDKQETPPKKRGFLLFHIKISFQYSGNKP